jgi:putative ABC transport system permease protein
MILRQLERQPVKAAMSAFGIALAVAVLVLGSFMEDAVFYVMDTQFQLAQRQDVTLTFAEPTVQRAVHDFEHLPGVQHCEPFRAVAATIRHGHLSRRIGVQGLEPNARLNLLMDMYRQAQDIPEDGLVLSRKLGDLVQARVGDVVTLEVLEGERPIREAPVVRLIEDFAGAEAYMNRHALNRLLREGPVISGAHVSVEPGKIDELYRTLKQTPRVAGVSVKEAALQSFRETVAENLLRMRFFNMIFACIIAFGVVYNSVHIALAERSRELATLRVIGFTRREVSRLLLGELAVLTLLAIPLGLLLGYGFAAMIVNAFDSELFRLPLVVERSTYGFAAAVTLGAALTSGLMVRRKIDHLDLVAVLKTRE